MDGRIEQGSLIEKGSRAWEICYCCCARSDASQPGLGLEEGKKGWDTQHHGRGPTYMRGDGRGGVAFWPTTGVQALQFDRMAVVCGMGMQSWLKEGRAEGEGV